MGKFLVILLVGSAVLAGGGLYYTQIYAFYEDVEPDGASDVMLTAQATDLPEPIDYDGFEAIDAASSPIRYRACFTTSETPDLLARRFVALPDAAPRNAPGWFDCFDAEAIAVRLGEGSARAFLGAKNVRYGVDRIVAVTDDGRGYVWHELNDCGTKAYDGTVIGEACPPRPEGD
ncbi:MAG: DUF6446 family protein [Rhodobacteraceae bacterium]|nr:DUF6446 family protein [Paracoccaceae bacterium]